MTTLHLLSGKAGSGKTTLGRRLADETNGVFFCEDEWLSKVGGPVASVADYVREAGRCRSVIGPLAVRLLRLGVPVIFDFAGNTVANRAWVRGLCESAGADVRVHLLDVPDDVCKARIRERNATRPEGVWWGDVSEAMFDAITPYFVPPGPDEGFDVVTYR